MTSRLFTATRDTKDPVFCRQSSSYQSIPVLNKPSATSTLCVSAARAMPPVETRYRQNVIAYVPVSGLPLLPVTLAAYTTAPVIPHFIPSAFPSMAAQLTPSSPANANSTIDAMIVVAAIVHAVVLSLLSFLSMVVEPSKFVFSGLYLRSGDAGACLPTPIINIGHDCPISQLFLAI